jgi:phosphocarrier protein
MMVEKTAIIRNRLGLHARPAAVLVQMAAKFKSQIKVIKDDQEVDGKSIMGLMTLAACVGTNLRIVANGPDEADAIAAITALVESGFNEE